MYCSHCINSSPGLILRKKINLLQVREETSKLRAQIDNILEQAMDGDSQDLLGKHLHTLKAMHYKRNTNKIRYKLAQLGKIVTVKRNRMKALEMELGRATKKDTDNGNNKPINGDLPRRLSHAHNAEYTDTLDKLTQIQRVLANTKAIKFQELVRLFLIRRRDHSDFPYTISFQPVVNLQNMYKLPQTVVDSSLETMWGFIRLASRILFINLPCKGLKDDVVDSITGMVINLLALLRYFKLIPPQIRDERKLVRFLLQNYDLDQLFYHTVMNRDIDVPSDGLTDTRIDFESCHDDVQQMLQGSNELSVLNKSMDDKWFLVG